MTPGVPTMHWKWRRAVPLLFLAWRLSGGGDAAVAEELKIELDSDSAPAIVTIVGPQSLLDRAAEVAKLRDDKCVIHQTFIGQGFGIDWGDDGRYGTQAEPPILGPDGCEDWLKHRYTVPGTYRIEAGLYHLGPTDMAISDWESATSVTIRGAPLALDFSLIDTVGGRTLLYNEPLPVEWELATGAPADLKLELVGENGKIGVTETLTGLTYVGRGKTTMRLDGVAYDDLVRPDMVKARVRATVTSGGQTLIRESSPFTLSSEIVFSSEDIVPHAELVADQPHTIAFSHQSYAPSCHDYLIDWGDGSSVERSVVKNPPDGCITRSIWIKSMHTYAKAGTYRIILRITDYSLKGSDEPESSPFYQAVTVTVP